MPKKSMRSNEQGNPIAIREFFLAGNVPPGSEVTVRIFAPRPGVDRANWECPYEIATLGGCIKRYAIGIDAVQSLQLVMPMVGAELSVLNRRLSGKLRWMDSEDLGFPDVLAAEEDR
jgi:hypothetical protein